MSLFDGQRPLDRLIREMRRQSEIRGRKAVSEWNLKPIGWGERYRVLEAERHALNDAIRGLQYCKDGLDRPRQGD